MYDVLFKGKFSPYGEIYNWVGSKEQLDKYDELKKEETQDLKVLAVVENRNNFDIVVIEEYDTLLNENDIDIKVSKRVKYLWLGNPYVLVDKYDYKSKRVGILPTLTQEEATLKEILNKSLISNNYFSNTPYLVEKISFGALGDDYIISTKEFQTFEDEDIDNNNKVSFIIFDLEVQFYISKENQLEYGLWNTENYRKEERNRDMLYGISCSNIKFYTNDGYSVSYTWNRFKNILNKNDAKLIKKLVRKDLLKSFLVDKINQP